MYTSLAKVAKAFKVPYSTLGHQAKGRAPNKKKAVSQQKLIEMDEKTLVQ